MALPPKKVVVVGSREAGVTVASRLQMSGVPTLIVGRGQGRNVRFEGWGQGESLFVYGLNQAPLSSANMVIITVKAYDLLGVIKRYVPYFTPGIPIVLACRGAIEDILQFASQNYPNFIWRRGLTQFSTRALNDSYMVLENSEKSCFVMGPPSLSLGEIGLTKPSRLEELIIDQGSMFFRWCSDLKPVVRRRWLEDTVIDTLCVAWEIERQGELLQRLEELREVFHEAYHLAAEHWGVWKTCEDQLFLELISTITKSASQGNAMAIALYGGARTESSCLANLAHSYRGYSKLKALHQVIQDFEREFRTLDRKQLR
ncbi:MAG: hypothetical protein AB8C84_05635 [Oligoflexales bacterium]